MPGQGNMLYIEVFYLSADKLVYNLKGYYCILKWD